MFLASYCYDILGFDQLVRFQLVRTHQHVTATFVHRWQTTIPPLPIRPLPTQKQTVDGVGCTIFIKWKQVSNNVHHVVVDFIDRCERCLLTFVV